MAHATMLGILPPTKCGRFRTAPVHVGDPDVVFPPASMLPSLMEEYCKGTRRPPRERPSPRRIARAATAAANRR